MNIYHWLGIIGIIIVAATAVHDLLLSYGEDPDGQDEE